MLLTNFEYMRCEVFMEMIQSMVF